jgi:hypothetical protein
MHSPLSEPRATLRLSRCNTLTDWGCLKLAQLSKDEKLDLALRWYLAVLTAESNPLANRRSVTHCELPEAVQLEAKPVLRQMVNQRVLQTGDEDIYQTL